MIYIVFPVGYPKSKDPLKPYLYLPDLDKTMAHSYGVQLQTAHCMKIIMKINGKTDSMDTAGLVPFERRTVL